MLSLAADPGDARGCSTNSFVIKWLSDGLWKYLYSAATPWRLKMMLIVIKYTILQFFRRFLILKGIPIGLLVQTLWQFCWIGGFAYWWSCIGKGLRLQPAQQDCYNYRLKKLLTLSFQNTHLNTDLKINFQRKLNKKSFFCKLGTVRSPLQNLQKVFIWNLIFSEINFQFSHPGSVSER